MHQTSHYINLLLALCGPVESVSAVTATAAHRLDVEDIGAAVLRFRNGAIGTILGSTAIFPGLTERLEISGSDGSAILEDGELVYLATREMMGHVGNHGLPWSGAAARASYVPAPHAPPYGGRHTDQIADFIAAVARGCAPRVTPGDGRAALALVLAIYRSAATHREVTPAAP